MPTESALACACLPFYSARVAGGAAQQLNTFNRSRRSHRLLTCSLALCVVVFVIIMYKMTLARCRLRLSQRRPLPSSPSACKRRYVRRCAPETRKPKSPWNQVITSYVRHPCPPPMRADLRLMATKNRVYVYGIHRGGACNMYYTYLYFMILYCICVHLHFRGPTGSDVP